MPIINLHKKISCTGLRAQVDHVLMEAPTQIFKTRCRVSQGFFQLKGDILHTVFFSMVVSNMGILKRVVSLSRIRAERKDGDRTVFWI